MTVFCLYPTPNWRNPPSGVYNNVGFRICIIENNTIKIKIEIDSLFTRTKLLLKYIIIYILVRKNFMRLEPITYSRIYTHKFIDIPYMPKTIHTRRNLSKKPTKRSTTSKRVRKLVARKPVSGKTRKNVPRKTQAKTRRLSLKKLIGGGFNDKELERLTTVLRKMNLFTRKERVEIKNELGLIAYFYSGPRFKAFIREIKGHDFKNKEEFMFWLKMKMIHLQYEVETDIEESDVEDAEADSDDEPENENEVGYMEDDGMKLVDYEDEDDYYNPNTYYKNDKKTIKTLIKHLQSKL